PYADGHESARPLYFAESGLFQSRSPPVGAGAAREIAGPEDPSRNSGGTNCRNRSVPRQRRCGGARGRRPDAAEFRSLRSSRSRLRLLHLWQSPLPECFLPARRSSRLRALSRPRAGGRHRANGRSTRDSARVGTGALAKAERTGAPVMPGVGLTGWRSSAVAGGPGNSRFALAKESDPNKISLLK